MNIEQIKKTILDTINCEELKENVFKINTGATFINGQPISFLIEQKNERWYLTDGKATLKYMNDMYDLKSSDVKMCISNVLKIYGFSIASGVLTAEIPNLDTFMDKYYDMLMCISQLANMFAFFDKP